MLVVIIALLKSDNISDLSKFSVGVMRNCDDLRARWEGGRVRSVSLTSLTSSDWPGTRVSSLEVRERMATLARDNSAPWPSNT